MDRSRQNPQVAPQVIGRAVREHMIELSMRLLPDRHCFGQESSSCRGQHHPAFAPARESTATLMEPRRSSGLCAAVNVVRFMARKAATPPMVGGSGRLRAIIKENCPLVIPSDLNASSKRLASARSARCTCRHRQWSRTCRFA